MGYLHQVVVHDVGEMVCGQLIGALVEHLVVEDVALHAHVATNEVVDVNFLAWLHLEADGVLRVTVEQLGHLFLRQREGVAHRHAGVGVVLEVFHLLALFLQFLRRVKGYVGLAVVEKLLHVFLVYLATLALAIRAVVAAERHAFVELDAEPFERLYDIVFCPLHETMAVGVLNAEHEFSTMLAGKQIVVQSRADSANVERTCWTWGETHPDFSF